MRFWSECLRKKKLTEKQANQVIDRAGKDGTRLYKYHCPHCQRWHVTKNLKTETARLQKKPG